MMQDIHLRLKSLEESVQGMSALTDEIHLQNRRLTRHNKWLLRFAVFALLFGLVGYGSWAEVPSIPFVYSGYLESKGLPVNGTKLVGVSLWTKELGGRRVCATNNPISTRFFRGRFQVKLPLSCLTALKGNRNLHIELNIEKETIPRMKLVVVPYAVEASRAETAIRAEGPLKRQLDKLEKRVLKNTKSSNNNRKHNKWCDCYNHNHWATFDRKRRIWGTCNSGYYLVGFHTSCNGGVYCIEEFRCCRPCN